MTSLGECVFSSGSKDHECLLLPALRLHMLRSEYVFKIVFNSCNSTTSVVNACDYGWKVANNQIFIVWDEDEVMKRFKSGKGYGCKAAKCDGSGAGCSRGGSRGGSGGSGGCNPPKSFSVPVLYIQSTCNLCYSS